MEADLRTRIPVVPFWMTTELFTVLFTVTLIGLTLTVSLGTVGVGTPAVGSWTPVVGEMNGTYTLKDWVYGRCPQPPSPRISFTVNCTVPALSGERTGTV